MRRLAFFMTFSLVLCLTAKLLAADDWTQKSSSTKPSAREYHAMSYLGSDKVMLYGGITESGKNSETWVYDLSENTWTQMNQSPNPGIRSHHAMAYLGDDQVLMFGGSDEYYIYTSSCWKYDLSDNTWTELNPATRPGSRRYHAMAYIGDGKVLLVGGQLEESSYTGETWVYETSSSTWTSKGGLGFGVFLHSLAYIGDDKVLLAGIRKEDGVTDDVYLFELSENAWTQKTDLPETRANGSMVYIGGLQTMYFGGYDSGWWIKNTTYIYSLNNNTWTTDINSSAPSERQCPRMAETSMDGTGYIVLFGGYTDSRNDETWTFGGGDYSLPVELSSFIAKSLSGAILLKWTTESETENLGFILQRKIVGAIHELPSSWSQIASYVTDKALEGHGSTSEKHEYQYTDEAVQPGTTYVYHLADVDYSGEVTWHKEVEVKVEVEGEKIPLVFGLQPVYPNPFNPSLTIPYGLAEDGNMALKVYNLRGELLEVLLSTYALKGTYSYTWQPQNLSAGIYFIRLQSGNKTNLQKVIFVK